MHPIAKALRARGWTQQQLVDKVNRLKPRRINGDTLELSQGHLSDVISENRRKSKRKPKRLSVPMAKAVAAVLSLDAAAILLYEPPAKPRRLKTA